MFSECFCTIIAAFSLMYGEYFERYFLLNGVLLPSDHELVFNISLWENSTNQNASS